MFDKRKYFDYELAYEGYQKAVDLFNKGGIDEIINDKDFDISGGATIQDWVDNGYVPLYACGYNITLYVVDRNFDTENTERDWHIADIDIYSYGGYDDNLYINDIDTIKNRLEQLKSWAREHDYSDEDYRLEKESLEKVLKKLENK